MDGEGLTTDQLKSLEEYLPTQEEEGQVIAPCNQNVLLVVRALWDKFFRHQEGACGEHTDSASPSLASQS
jgi:hypothetical protein